MGSSHVSQGVRSPLKWPGGKKRVLHHIRACLPRTGRRRLVEPFVGGGSVFLNLDFDEYLLCDTNSDLISLYQAIKKAPLQFERDARAYFTDKNNTPDRYYSLRQDFNSSTDPYARAVLFLYLNRHGYNGLCRYNQSGGYNVPFGRYKKPYFPELEIEHLSHKLKKASFLVGDFEHAFDCLEAGDVVYCDPPYSPLNPTSNFTAYSGHDFSENDQTRLVRCAIAARQLGIPSLISNHYTAFTETLYATADQTHLFSVQRSISQNGKKRHKVQEILALYANIKA